MFTEVLTLWRKEMTSFSLAIYSNSQFLIFVHKSKIHLQTVTIQGIANVTNMYLLLDCSLFHYVDLYQTLSELCLVIVSLFNWSCLLWTVWVRPNLVSAYVFPFGKGAMLWCTPWEQENCKNKSKLCTIRRQTVAALNTFWKSSSWNLIKIEIGATYLKKLFKHLGRKKLWIFKSSYEVPVWWMVPP